MKEWLAWHIVPPVVAGLLVWLKVHYGHHKIRLDIKELSLRMNGDSKKEEGQS